MAQDYKVIHDSWGKEKLLIIVQHCLRKSDFLCLRWKIWSHLLNLPPPFPQGGQMKPALQIFNLPHPENHPSLKSKPHKKGVHSLNVIEAPRSR
jgi:hypothetical protein